MRRFTFFTGLLLGMTGCIPDPPDSAKVEDYQQSPSTEMDRHFSDLTEKIAFLAVPADETMRQVQRVPPIRAAAWKNAANRRQVAVGLRHLLVIVDSSIPNLSPSQLEWLANEGKARAGANYSLERMLMVSNSVELKIEQVKRVTKPVIAALTRIAEGKVSNTREEMYLWAIVSLGLGDQVFTEAWADLITKKVIASDMFDRLSFYIVSSAENGRAILAAMVIPWLGGRLD